MVRGLALLPSAFMTQMFSMLLPASLPSSAREEAKAILLLSGDHTGDSVVML